MDNRTSSRPLPEPAPGFAALVGIHIRLLAKDSQAGTLILVLACVVLPLSALLTPLPVDPMDYMHPTSQAGRLEMFVAMMTVLTIAMAFLWPEAVWRGLGPGERMVLDTFPVARRKHRMARVVAGALIPMALAISLIASGAILRAREWGHETMRGAAAALMGASPYGLVVMVMVLLTGYAFSSSLGLRFGKVFSSLLAIGTALYLVPSLMLLLGWEALMSRLDQWMIQSAASPFRLLTRAVGTGSSADLVPALVWLGIMVGVTVYLAGRHGKA